MKTCVTPRDNDTLIEMTLYALMGINSAAGRNMQTAGVLQTVLLSTLRDLLLESGTQPPPALDRLVSRSRRIHQRRQRRRLRQTLRQGLQQSEESTRMADYTSAVTASEQHVNTSLSTLSQRRHPRLTTLTTVAQELDLSQLASYSSPHHQVMESSPEPGDEGSTRGHSLPERQRRQRCLSESSLKDWLHQSNEE
ncbi:uncharacterized protein [Cherax quadricarinatus]|uniref:uncharacterized protein n=1 Tax=Cherax quadricarinatus TaxID=27406 RepID=UPI00387EAFA9